MTKKQLYKLYTMLSFLLLLRHAQYYLGHDIITEYGFDQPILGVALIPITAAFGTAFFISRRNISISGLNGYLRLFFLLAFPFILALFQTGAFGDIMDYGKYDTSRRPSFLILIPIFFAICIFIINSKLHRYSDGLLIILSFLVILIADNFILYYTALMLTAGLIINNIQPYLSPVRSITVYLATLFFILLTQTERLTGATELIYLISFLGSLIEMTRVRHIPAFRFSMLEFYIVQAVVFSGFKFLHYGLIMTPVVAFLTYFILFVFRRLSIYD